MGLLLAAVGDAQGRGWPVVAHNGWKFVVPFLRVQAWDWLGQDWDVAGDDLVDTGLMEKARLAGVVPYSGERPEGFWPRARHAYGAGWSLQDDCVPRYGLAGQPGLEPDQAHRAAFGALAALKQLALVRNLLPPRLAPLEVSRRLGARQTTRRRRGEPMAGDATAVLN